MRRIIIFLIALMIFTSFVACNNETESSESNENNSETVDAENSVELDLSAEADAIVSKYSISGGKRYTSASTEAGKYLDEDLIRSYYGDATALPDFNQVEAYEVYIDESKPIHPCEFGLFKMKDGANTEEFILFLKARIELKIENAKAYPTMDTEPLKTAVFTAKGDYIWYVVVKGGNADINNILEGKFE